MSRNNILITGDSWGAGEWGYSLLGGESRITHKGFEQYARDDGFNVFNQSAGGHSLVELFYSKVPYPLDYYDYQIVFVTEPLRKVRLEDRNISNIDNLIDLQTTIFRLYLDYLSFLPCRSILLGGPYKIDTSLTEKYINIEVAIPSISEFLIPSYKQPKIWIDNVILSTIENLDTLLKEEIDTLLLYKKQSNFVELSETVEEAKLFIPDGGHPNRHAHKIIYEYVRDNYLLN